jgi:F-box domain
MESLIPDLLRYILDLLSKEDVVIARFVCQRWRRELTHKKPGKIKLNKYIDNIKLAQWVYQKGCPHSDMAWLLAAGVGHVDFLEWADRMNLPVGHGDLTDMAICHGQIKVLTWLKSHHKINHSQIMRYNVETGNLEVIRWAISNKYLIQTTTTINELIRRGELEMVKFAHENGCPWDHYSTLMAVSNSHHEIFNYLIENGCPHNKELCALVISDDDTAW